MNLLKVKHKKTVLAICFIINLMILGASTVISIRFANNFIELGGTRFAVSSFNGSLQAVMFVLCILMVGVDTKVGLMLSYFCLIFSILGALRATFTDSGLTSLPGVINSFVLIISITIISEQIRTTILDSQTDGITEAFNRRGFIARIQDAVRQRKSFKLVSIRLLNFRKLCDDLGLEHGDDILRVLSERIKKVSSDNDIIGVIDPSNFGVMIFDDRDVQAFATKLSEEIENRVVIHRDPGTLNCELKSCIGIASYPENGKNADEVMKKADLALRHCVNTADKKIVVYDSELQDYYARYTTVEKAIRESLSNGYFYLVYQPQFIKEGKKLRGFETLLRMQHPSGEEYDTSEFIMVAEKSNLILSIDEYVLNRAMTEFADVVRQGDNMLTLSVNISGKSLASPGFVKLLNKAVRDTEFPPECLEIEVEERMFATPSDDLEANVRALKRMGVKIALDDFGSGYSSMAQLMHLRISLLKIDKSLIDDIVVGRQSREFLDSIIRFGHTMGSSVISQGVETEEQLTELKNHEVDMIQGFVWGLPLSYNDAIELTQTR